LAFSFSSGQSTASQDSDQNKIIGGAAGGGAAFLIIVALVIRKQRSAGGQSNTAVLSEDLQQVHLSPNCFMLYLM
jgi:hypothetical protein